MSHQRVRNTKVCSWEDFTLWQIQSVIFESAAYLQLRKNSTVIIRAILADIIKWKIIFSIAYSQKNNVGIAIAHQIPGRYFSTARRFLELTCNLEEGCDNWFTSLTPSTAHTFLSHSKQVGQGDLTPRTALSALVVQLQGLLHFFWISGATRPNKCSNLQGDIRKKLKM